MPVNDTGKNTKKKNKIIIPVMMIAIILLMTGCTVKDLDGNDLVISDEVVTTDYYSAVIPAGWTILYTYDKKFQLLDERNQEFRLDVNCDKEACEEEIKRAKKSTEESIKNGEKPSYIVLTGNLNGNEYYEITRLHYTGIGVSEHYRSIYFPTENVTYIFEWGSYHGTDAYHCIYDKWTDDEKTVKLITSVVTGGNAENAK